MLIAGKQVRGGLGVETLGGVARVTLPSPKGMREWKESVPAAGIVANNNILAALAPALDTDQNDPEMLDVLSLSATAGVNQITFNLSFGDETSGPVNLLWKVI